MSSRKKLPGQPEISWDAFAELRLAQFLPKQAIRRLRQWEFMDRVWVGEAAGFTEWLRLEDEPRVLRSMALDFARLADDAAERMLARLGTALRPGMDRRAVSKALGEPDHIETFPRAPDRETLVFLAPRTSGYHLHCTLQRKSGLVFLLLLRGDWAR
jgi:hypothetical protein